MAARDGMANLIARLRGMCAAGTADYTLAGVAYWTDEQLQTRLDDTMRELRNTRLQYRIEDEAGTSVTRRYYSPQGELEEAASGTVYWKVVDNQGNVQGTADYTVDYQQGIITFDSDTDSEDYYLYARSYNLNRAAANVWDEIAASVWTRVDVDLDGQQVSRSQQFKAASARAQEYRRRAGGRIISLMRSDTV